MGGERPQHRKTEERWVQFVKGGTRCVNRGRRCRVRRKGRWRTERKIVRNNIFGYKN